MTRPTEPLSAAENAEQVEMDRVIAEAESSGHAQAIAEAEAHGYARGVEDAKQIVGGYGLTVAEVVTALDALLKPKGEAK